MSRADAMRYMGGRSKRAGSTRSNRLPILAAEIKEAVADAQRHAKASLESAMVAGERLIEAKQHMIHGEWLPWLREHAGLSERTAQVYMRLSRERDEIAKYADAADLTIEGALELARAQARLKATATNINRIWNEGKTTRREFVRSLGEARQAFKDEGDEAGFVPWLIANAPVGKDFAEKIPAMLDAEDYDDNAWSEAMLGDIEGMLLCRGGAP